MSEAEKKAERDFLLTVGATPRQVELYFLHKRARQLGLLPELPRRSIA